MTNSDVGGQLAVEMAAAVAREYGWPGFEPREIVAVAMDSTRLEEIAGRYASADGRPYVASRDGSDLAIVTPTGRRYVLVATGADTFALLEDGGGVLRIERDGTGRITAFQLGPQRFARQP